MFRSLELYFIWLANKEKFDDLYKPGDYVNKDNSLWLLYKKVGNSRLYKVEVTKYIWGSLSQMYDRLVWSNMLALGYILVPLENGWVLHNPITSSNYQLTKDSCTCAHFSYSKTRCKHLVFKDAELLYKATQTDLYDKVS